MRAHGIVYALMATALVVSGQVTLKVGMTRVGPIGRQRLARLATLLVEVLRTWQVWLGLGLYILSAALWILALATIPAWVAYPILALSYVAIAAVSVSRLGEWLTPAQWIGIALVVSGVIIVTAVP